MMELEMDRFAGRHAGLAGHPRRASRVAVMVLAGCCLAAHAGFAARPAQKVALVGETAPGTGGGVFTATDSTGENGPDEPYVNSTGDVAFGASFSGPGGAGAGVFLHHAGALSAVAVSGQTVPGLGTLVAPWNLNWDGPGLNNSGTVVLAVFGVTGSAATSAILQKNLSGPLTVLVKQGDPVPGTAAVFDIFQDPGENDNGDVAFTASYIDFGVRKSGVFLKPSGGAITAVLLNGDALPGTGGGTYCGAGPGGRDDLGSPLLNDLGVVAFVVDEAAICGGSGGLGGSLFARRPGFPLEPFILLGEAAPPSVGGTIKDIGINRPGLTNSNLVAFKAEVNGGAGPNCAGATPCGIFTKTLGATGSQPCVAGGAGAPGTAGTFDDFDPPAVNRNGVALFEGVITGDAAVKSGLFTCAGGTVQDIALQGDPKPGTGFGFGDNIADATPSDNGLVAFVDTNSTVASGPEGVFVATRAATGCVDSPTTLCLSNGRFAVSATWATHTASGDAQVVKLTPDTGYLWFFSSSNVEAVVKVLNACTLNAKYWVFAGGLTNVKVVLTVTDTATGLKKTYRNPADTTFQPIQDTSAFACGSASSAVGPDAAMAAAVRQEAAGLHALAGLLSAAAPRSAGGPPAGLPVVAAAGTCPASSTALCLSNGRFKVEATFDTGTQSGQAQAVPLTVDTGYLWFFSPTNVEAVVKVLNACSLNNHFWVFAGGLTNVKVKLTVTDTQNGLMKVYNNPANTTFQPIQDTSAFATCP
jgi:hypothetical protein